MIAVGASNKTRNAGFASGAPITNSVSPMVTAALGSTIVVMVIVYKDATPSGNVASVTDNKGNTYNPWPVGSLPGGNGVWNTSVFVAENCTGGSNHIISVNGADIATQTGTMFVVEFTDAAASSIDGSTGSNDVSSPFSSAGPVTPTQPNTMLVGLCGGGGSFNSGNVHSVHASSAPTSGWGAAIVEETDDSAASPRGAIFAQRVTSAAAYNFVYTVASGPSAAVSGLLVLKENMGGGGGGAPLMGQACL